MEAILKQAQSLQSAVVELSQALNVEAKQVELSKLSAQLADPDIWQDSSHAQDISKQQARLQAEITPWQDLAAKLSEIAELAELGDASLLAELSSQLNDCQTTVDQLKKALRFNGPYDSFDAIVSIHAGAGGTDAQDWAAMLLRMYVRWAESSNCTVTTIDESAGEEAGIKSVTLDISGQYAYGKLQGEHGVHRLVRLSPFNADSLRQTSFAKVEVTPKIDRPEAVVIDDKDLKIDVYRSGGKGGQSVNTTDSAVRITHLPTNIVIAIQNERSQLQNKETAMTILRGKLAQLQVEQHAADIRELRGPNEQAAWGNQIRSYVLHPYKQVKDLRTRFETSDPDAVLDGKLTPFIDAYLEHTIAQ